MEFASALCRTDRDRHVIYLSGRDRTADRLLETARVALGEGFRNFCAVSGMPFAGEDADSTFRHRFTESVHTLSKLHEECGDRVITGCTVNPYKYVAEDLCLQYAKLAKKINFGARFAVAQYGWDMQKLQELRWNLFQRSLNIPTVARLLFLTPERAEAICTGRVPGVHISPDLEKVLKHEMQFSRAQFEAAQIRRLQIHAAGARFLGYSGIQLSGVDTASRLEVILYRIAQGLEEFENFEAWCGVYRQYYERLDMAPYPYRFYFFENLLTCAQPPENLMIRDAKIAPLSTSERMALKVGKGLFSHAGDVAASERRLTKKMLFSCRGCGRCRLPETFYICPETCPMHRANGPCGESNADGTCFLEAGKECIFRRQMRIVNELRDYPALEERLVPDGGQEGE